MSYKIITDTCCDLSEQMYADLGLTVVALSVTIKGETINQYTEERLKVIYAALREKEHATTAAANPCVSGTRGELVMRCKEGSRGQREGTV